MNYHHYSFEYVMGVQFQFEITIETQIPPTLRILLLDNYFEIALFFS